MARRAGLGVGLTALRAALGAVSGGLEGYTQAQERERKKFLEDAALKRQQEQDAMSIALNKAALAEKGWMAEPEFETKRQQAGMGVGSAIASALSMAGGGPIIATQGDLGAATEGVLTPQPAGRMEFGGTKMVLPESSFARQQREKKIESAREVEQFRQQENIRVQTSRAAANQEREEKRKQLKDAGMSDKDITAFLDLGARYGDVYMSPSEKARLAMERTRINLSEREYNLRKQEQDRRESDSQFRRERIPVGAQGRLEKLDSGVIMVNDVVSALTENPKAVGPIKGRIWRSALDVMDKEGVAVRAAIEAVAGEVRNQRFGGALTATEAKFAEGFLPSEKDTYEAAITKLQGLQNYLEKRREGIFRTYKQEYQPIYGAEQNPYR